MTDATLIDYLFDSLDADERATIESHLRADPTAATRLDSLRGTIAHLLAEAQADCALVPPEGLAFRTVGRVAEYLATHEPSYAVASDHAGLSTVASALAEPDAHPLAFPSPMPRAPRAEPDTRVVGGRLRLDIFVAAGIALIASGLLFSAVSKVRSGRDLLACQQNLHTLYTGLAGYADTHDGRYPQIGVGGNPTAGTFATALADSGQVPVGFRPGCPAVPASPNGFPAEAGYTYTLGYRTPNGWLLGLTQPGASGDEHDLIPISADFPSAAAAPAAGQLSQLSPHANGMNVLFAGGHVRHTTTPLIGPNGDDIYRNVFGLVEAGAARTDIVLGRPGDKP